MGLDPRMIRFSVVKLGDKLGVHPRHKQGALEDITGKVEWNHEQRELLHEVVAATGLGNFARTHEPRTFGRSS